MNFSWKADSLPIDPLRFLEEQTGAGLYLLDIATGQMSWSDGVYRLFGLSRNEVNPSRQVIRDLIHPKDRKPIEEMDRLFGSGIPFQLEYRIILRDRRTRWISNHADFLLNASGEPATVIGVYQDASSLHLARDLLGNYKRQLDAFLELRPAVAWKASADGNITSVPGWQTVFGAAEEPLGLTIFDIIHPDDRNRTEQDWLTAVAQGNRYISEHRILDPDGNYRWRQCSALPIRSEDSTIIEWLGITADVHNERTGNSIRGVDALTTGAQIRAARSIVRLSVRDLSELSGVPIGTIRRIEDIDGVSTGDQNAVDLLRAKLEDAGVTFLFPAGTKPAVCPN